MSRPIRIGHRGAAGHAPENTLRAIETGIAMGADMIEVDVQRSSDGHLLIIHDDRVERTTNGTGAVAQMTLKELRSLDAGNGERLPTLDEVLTATSGRAGVMLELKVPGIARDVAAAVRVRSFQGEVVFASFFHAELLAVREVLPDALTLALIEAVPVKLTAFAEEARATHAGISRETATPDFVAALHDRNIRIFVYTVNAPADVHRIRGLGVDGLISDFPDRL